MQKSTGTKSANKIDLALTKMSLTLRRIFVIMFFLFGAFASNVAKAQFSAVPVTGFNADVVADGTTNVDATATTTAAVDATTAGANFVFTTSTFRPSGSASACATAATSWPTSITSTNTTTASGITYNFQPATSNNTLRVTSAAPADLTLVTPTNASALYVVCLGGSGLTAFTAKINFSDLSSETVSSSAPDWCGGAATNKLPNATSPQVFYRIVRTATTCTGATCQYMYEMPLPISPANYLKSIVSVTFTNTTGSTVFLHILAMGKKATCTLPPDGPTAFTTSVVAPGYITANFTGAVSVPAGYLVVRYPTGASPVNPVNATTYTAGQSLGTGVVVQSSASTSFTTSFLTPSTGYDFYVYPYNSGASCGGPIYNPLQVLTATVSTPACGTFAGGTYSIGPNAANFPTLTAAFAALASGPSGPVTFELQSAYTSSGETFPINVPYIPCMGATPVTIRPETGAVGLQITSSNATGTINFSGASNITVDGRPGGLGIISQLTIANTNIGSSYAVNFSNDAVNNTVKYCTVTSRNTATTGGTIVFGTASVTGNDNNTIDNCSITDDGGGFPVNAIYSAGTSASIDNSNNIVSNNNISNYFSAGSVSTGILLAGTGNSGWAITNNRLFQTANRIFTTGNTHSGISVQTGSGYTISGNIIGFANNAGTGTTNLIGNSTAVTGTFPDSYTVTTTNANTTRYIGINCAFTAAGTNSLIQNNTIAGFALYSSSGASTTNGIWCGINVASGNVTIGGASAGLGNTIGAATGLGSVYTICSTTGGTAVGIYATSANTVTIQNNTIGAIDAVGTSGSITGGFTGIDAAGTAAVIESNNTIGNSTTDNIRTGYTLSGANLSNAGTLTSSTGTTSAMVGIRSTATGNGFAASNNILRGWATSGTVTAATGIISSGTMSGTNAVIVNSNAIGTGALRWINFAFANSGTVTGISVANTVSTSHSIQNNDFQGIVYAAASSGAHTYINFTGGTAASDVSTIAGNTFTNLNVNTTANVTFISHSYAVASTGVQTINNNSIVTAFNKAGAGNTVACIASTGASVTGAVINHTNNNFSNITVTGATAINGIANAETGSNGPTRTVTGNTFNNWTGGSGAITAISYATLGGSSSISNNIVTGITSQAAITGINISNTGALANPLLVSGNTINTLTSNVTGGAITGISCANASTVVNITGHSIFGLSSTGAAAVIGISIGGSTLTNVFKNSICSISGSNAGTTVNGILVSGGTTVSVYNNRVAGLTAPISNGANQVIGLNITGGTNVNAYYNSVVLSGTSSGAAFGSSAVSAITSATLTLRNNILINNTTPVGTGFTVAYRRSSNTLTSYATASNNNIFYAGNPNTNNLIFTDGTNSDQTLAAYKTRVSPKDGASFTENTGFLSTNCGDANFLKVNAGTATFAEGNAASIAGITDDFEGDARSATKPDIGADEFAGIAIPVVFINSVSATPATTQCVATPRTITANITAGNTNITSVTLNYSYNGTAQPSVTMSGGNPNAGQTSDWTATLPAATPTNASVLWTVTAVDAASVTKVATGTGYSDDPLNGVTAAATSNPSSVCSGTSVILNTALTKNRSGVMGAGGTNSTTTAATFLPGGWGGAKTQFIVKASELTAAGLVGGDFKSLAFETGGTPGQTYTGFTVQIGHTNATAMTTTLLSTPMTQVYKGTLTNDGFLPIGNGVNTLVFGTGTGSLPTFTWDGVSNIVVSVCWSSVPAATNATATSVKVDATGFTSSAYDQTDNATPSAECSTTTGDNTGSNRPKFTFVENIAPLVTAVSWSDGVGTVGTGNPITVNPTNLTASPVVTTYTATITAAGCTTTASANVTVAPLPGAPGGNNSTQCGTAVPAAFVTGAAPANFRWYSAQTGGTPIQSGGASFTGSISTTTHFWVSITNGTCESSRTDVLASVSPADPIQAAVNNNNVCLNTAIALSATATPINPLSPNTYTYSWSASPASGSGIPTTVSGNPVSVTPTASGTYTYTATATDVAAGCTTTSTVVVTVKSLPVIASATATPATVCAGVSSTLNGSGLPQFFNIPVTGFNFDVVANGTGAVTASTTGDLDNVYTFAASDWNFSGACTPLTNFMPASGQVTANATVVGGALTYILQPYTANNDLRIPATGAGVGSGTLTLTTPTTASKLFMLYAVGNGPITSGITVTVTFTDASTQVFTGLTGLDWFATSGFAIQNLGRVNKTTAACQTTTTGGPGLFDLAITLSAGNTSKLIQSITLQNTTAAGQINVMAVGGFRTSVPYNWSWNPGSLSGSSVVVTPASTTTYTVTATDPATTCSNTTTVAVTVNQLPPVPSGTNGTDQCGTAVTDAFVSSNNITDPQAPPFFKWYSAPTGGTLLQSGTSTTYTTPIGITTDFYVSEVSANGCEGPRVHIATIVSDADVLTVSASPTNVCSNGSTNISSAYTPLFNSFATFNLTATGGAASGITGTVSLTPNGTGDGSDPYTVTPTASGTYTYTITAFDPDKGCTSVGTVVVTVNPNPVITSASASPVSICAGASSTLTAVTGASAQTTVQIGSGTSTVGSSTTNGAFYGGYYGNGHAQILIKASELTALGFLPGNLTNLKIDISALGGGSVTTFNGFTIKLASVSAATTAISTFQSPTFTTVYGPTDYTPVVGTNTHTFISPYAWDGVSNIIVDYCFTSGVTGTVASAQNTTTTTSFGSFVNHQIDGSAPTECTNTSVTNATSVRPNIKFTGLVGALGAGPYSWTWNPGNLSGNVQTVTPSTTTTYTATATFNGCTSNSAPVTVTVNQLPAAPSTNDPVSRCGLGSVTLTATGTGGTLHWYNVASGGTSLQTGGTYTTSVTANTSFWVAETSAAGCEGPRTQVHVTVTTPPTLAIAAGGPTAFCQGSSVTLNGSTGSDPGYNSFTWSVSPTTGAGLSGTTGANITVTPTVNGTYTITLNANDGSPTGCANVTTITVTMNPNPVSTTVVASPSAVCSGGIVTLTGQPQFMNVPVTGYNVDAVANGTGPVASSTTSDLDNVNTLVASDWNYDGSCTALTNFMPVSGTVAANSSIASGLVYNLQPYNQLNDLRIPATGGTGIGSGTLNLVTPTAAGTLYLLYSAGNGPITSAINVTVTFTDNSTQVFSNLTAVDWFASTGFAVQNLGRVNRSTAACQTTTTGGPGLFDMVLALSASNYAKKVQSIKVDKTVANGIMNIVAVGMASAPQIAGTVNWSWNPGNLTGNPVTVNPTSTTTYTATATSPSTGCSSSNTVTVTVGVGTATATATPATPICAGTSVTLNGGAVGTAPLSYSWASTPAGSYPATASINVTPAITTAYTVTVTDGCSNTFSSTVTVNVNPLPTASIQEGPGPLSVCSPATQSLHAVTDAGAASYQWTLNGTNIAGATSSIYTVSSISTGAYRVIVTNTATNCVSAVSSPVTVTVNYTPTGVTAGASTSVTCNGTPINLTSSADAFPSTILTQNWESGMGAWTAVNTSAAITAWTIQTNPYTSANTTPVTFNSNSGSKFILSNADIGGSGTSINTILTSPVFSTMNYTSLNLAFNHYYKFLSTTEAFVEVSTDGSTWTTVKSYTANQGGPAAFAAESISLNTYINNPTVQVRFRYQDGWSWYWAIDDIAVTGAGVTYSYNWASNPAGFTSTAQNPTGVTPSTTTTYSVTVSTAAGCSTTASTTVTVNPRPTGVITGGATYCAGQGSTTTNLSLAVTGAGPWNGTLSDGTAFSGSSSPITVSVTPSSTTTYTIATLNGSQCSSIAADLSGSATVTINPVPATPTITPAGPVTQCGGTVTLTSSSATGNQWNLNGSPIVGATNSTLVVSASGNYSVTVTNGFNCSATSSAVSVTINPVPATPTISAGGPITFCAGGSVTLTSSSASNNQWNLNGSPISGATNSTLVVTASGDYTVTVTNGFGCSATSAITTVTVNPLAATPTASVVQPTCAVGTGTINVTSPLGAGNTYSLDGTTFQSSPSFPGKAPGTYTLYVHNTFGCFAPATINVTVDPQPFIPAAPTVTGTVNVCPFIAPTGGAPLTYHASSPGATSYTWTIPPSRVYIVSGQGTADLTLKFDTGYANVNNKQIRVTATSVCGTSPTFTIFYTLAQYPGTPNPIAGPTDACPFIGTANTATYTINKATSATGYIWNLPTGATATHPNGAGTINDTTIIVTYGAGFTASGNITVFATNDCGTSGARNLFITRNAPAQPGLITGPTNACEFSAPNGTPATYSVLNTPGITYTWTPPAGSTNLTGQGTSTISFIYPNGYTTGFLSVVASSGCGTSTPRTLTVNRLNAAIPSVIDVIQTHFCGEAPSGNSRVFTYTVSSMPANAISVQWTVPTAAGAVLVSGQGTTSITVSYPDAAVNGTVTAQGVNNCGASTIRSTTVHLPACPPPGFAGNNTGSNQQVKGATAVATPTVESMEVKIFPNPTVSDFKLQVITSQKEEINVRVIDNEGRLFKTFKVMPYQTIALGAELKPGSYMVEVRQGKTVKTTKVIKF